MNDVDQNQAKEWATQ